MKIEIEFDSSHEANIIIDGKKLKYGCNVQEGIWEFLEGMENKEWRDTIGGMIAVQLASRLPSILQGWLPTENEYNLQGDNWGTWEKLSDAAADEIYDKLNR